METEALIHTLADDATPVGRLLPPERRALLWLALTTVYLAGAVLVIGLRPDIAEAVGDGRTLIETGAALATGILAAMAAFCAACPGRPVWERAMPLPALVLWFGLLAESALEAWTGAPRQAVTMHADFAGLLDLPLLGVPPTVLLLAMLRRGVPIVPVVTGGLAMLAVASLIAAALRFIHPEDASVMLLVWQFGPVVLLSLLGAVIGPRLLPWPRSRLRSTSDRPTSRKA